LRQKKGRKNWKSAEKCEINADNRCFEHQRGQQVAGGKDSHLNCQTPGANFSAREPLCTKWGEGAGFCLRLEGGSSLTQTASPPLDEKGSSLWEDRGPGVKPGPSAAGVGTSEALGQRAHVTNAAMAEPPPHSVAAGPRGAPVEVSGRLSESRLASCLAESCGRGGVARWAKLDFKENDFVQTHYL